MVEPLEAFVSPKYKRVIWVMGSQMGKTTGQFIIIGHRMDDNPAPILYIGPTKSNIDKVVEPKVSKMFWEVPSLSKKMAGGQKDTKTQKIISGISFRMAWAGSASEMAADSAVIVLIDERDRMEKSVKGEGDPVELGDARSGTYPDGKTGVASTPSVGNIECKKHPKTGLEHWEPSDEVSSAIWKLWQDGTRHEWAWPCPDCKEYFIPRLKLLSWPEDATPSIAAKQASLICPNCGSMIESIKKAWMNQRGRHVAPGQKVSKKGVVSGIAETDGNDNKSHWISGICSFSSKKSFGFLARKLCAAYKSKEPEKVQAVINVEFGECYAVAGEAQSWELVKDRRAAYKTGEVVPSIRILTCGVDVQKNRLVYSVRGWGQNYESWLIESGEIFGETDKPMVWVDLGELLEKEFDGHFIRFMAVDSGYQKAQVYTFCKKYRGKCFPTKGSDGLKKDFTKSPTDMFADLELISFHPDPFKMWVQSRLEWPVHEPGGWWVPADISEDYCRQLTAEKRVVKPSGKVVWVKVRRDNHFFDAEVLNYLIIKIGTRGNPNNLDSSASGKRAGRRVINKGA